MADFTEKEVLIKVQRGEIEHFRFFVEKYSRPLLSYTKKKVKNSDDAEDIVQNTFIKIYKAIEKLDPERAFYPYLFSVLKNEIAEFYRKEKSHLPLIEDLHMVAPSPEEDVRTITRNLPKEQKRVLQLYYLDGYAYQEIAEKLQKPLNTIKTLMRRGKLALREEYSL